MNVSIIFEIKKIYQTENGEKKIRKKLEKKIRKKLEKNRKKKKKMRLSDVPDHLTVSSHESNIKIESKLSECTFKPRRVSYTRAAITASSSSPNAAHVNRNSAFGITNS